MAEECHIGTGGPLHRLERAAHIEGLGRAALLLTAISWLPLAAIALFKWSVFGRAEPFLLDLTIHARLLVALPLFLTANWVLDQLCALTITRLFAEGYIPPEHASRVRAFLRRVEAWRDSTLPEMLMLVSALLVGVATLFGWAGSAGVVTGVVATDHSAVRLWYALVSLPLFQFVLWQSLFRWALWVRLLFVLSRVPLRLLPMHADQRGGIGFVSLPTTAYCATILLASSSILCAGWATQVRHYGVRTETFKPLFFGFVLVGGVLAFAPLLLFVPQLARARVQGRWQFGALVSDYSRRFQERWVGAQRPDPLGTPDIQSLADLTASYRDNLERMRVLLASPKDIVVLVLAASVPAVPLLFLQHSAHEVVRRIVSMLFRGAP
jgi:hypothetical protein